MVPSENEFDTPALEQERGQDSHAWIMLFLQSDLTNLGQVSAPDPLGVMTLQWLGECYALIGLDTGSYPDRVTSP